MLSERCVCGAVGDRMNEQIGGLDMEIIWVIGLALSVVAVFVMFVESL